MTDKPGMVLRLFIIPMKVMVVASVVGMAMLLLRLLH